MTDTLFFLVQFFVLTLAGSVVLLLLGYYLTMFFLTLSDWILRTPRTHRNIVVRQVFRVVRLVGLLLRAVSVLIGVPTLLWDWVVNHVTMTVLMGERPRRFAVSQGYCYTVTLRFRYYRTPEYRAVFPNCWRTWVASHVCDCWLNWADSNGTHC